MKKLVIPVLAGLGLCLAPILTANAQDYKEHISKKFTLQKPAAGTVLAVYNINGPIKVEGYAGAEVQVEIDQIIAGRTAADVDQGKNEFKLAFDQKSDSIICYTSWPYDSRPSRNHWNYNTRENKRYYNVRLEYTIKVPFNTNLAVSTVNRGDVSVKDVYGVLKVNNVNGAIKIENAKSKTRAHTVNGPVEVSYLTVPSDSSSYHTINGKIEVSYPASLSADLSFKSMNGKFYTDFQNLEALPGKVIKTESQNSKGVLYKLTKNSAFRIGSGGRQLTFETLNGNIYIKKI